MQRKKYSFYEKDPILQEILDELVRSRKMSTTIHKLLLNGLGKDIRKSKKELKERLKAVGKMEKRYNTLQSRRQATLDKAYNNYVNYRKNLEKGNTAYIHKMAMSWIDEQAKKAGKSPEELLSEFEERYEKS